MTSATIRADAGAVRVAWPDGDQADFPFLWLRDNCPSGFHPETRERQFDLLSVASDIRPASVAREGETLAVTWAADGHVSRFPVAWLRRHRPGRPAPDPAAVAPITWRGDGARTALPQADAAGLMADDARLRDWLVATKRLGLGLVTGIADGEAGSEALARRVGFLRETNFGVDFTVVSKPDPNNLAYTAERLPLHTDLPNQELAPGFQFLHCLANEAAGGGSLLCDGFAVAEDLRRSDPAAFDLLARVTVPFRFQDGEYDIRHRATVLRLDEAGAVAEVRFSPHLADSFDMPAAVVADYYAAYRRFMRLTRDPAYVLTLRLTGGEMMVFDNRRVLHGRDAFDPSTGHRHLHGFYVDRGEVDSRIRVLSRRV